MERQCTAGFARLLEHNGPEIPAWQRNVIGGLFSSYGTVENGWIARLHEGEFIEWESGAVQPFDPNGNIVLALRMAMGFGPDGYMPSGEFVWYVNGKPLLEFCVVKYSTRWEQEGARFYFDVMRKVTQPETAVCGIGCLLLPASLGLEHGKPVRLSLRNRKKAYTRKYNAPWSERWVRVDEAGGVAGSVYMDDALTALTSDRIRRRWGDRTLYFGDIHAHSGRTEQLYEQGEREFLRGGNCGIGTPENCHRYARYASQLDFFCQTDHHRGPDRALSEKDWAHRIEVAHKWTDDRFVALLGCELISRVVGHWNLYFRDEAPAYPPHEALPFDEIKQILKARSDKLMLIPHQTSTLCCAPINWDAFDPELSPLVEIYSHWGSDEYHGNPLQCIETGVNPNSFVDVALKRGYRLGFIGSTDEHGGAPGDGIRFYNPVGSGLACVWAPELTREAVFDSLAERRCYATTGVRMMLQFEANGRPMGSQVEAGQQTFRVTVDAPGMVKEIVMVKNGFETEIRSCRSRSEQWEWCDDTAQNGDFYYPRIVLNDGETAWSSPIWVAPKNT